MMPLDGSKPFAGIESYLLNLAGEYRVCSELCKRGMFATISYGHRKSADVYVIFEAHRKVLRTEVKTTQKSNFVTSITQKKLTQDSPEAPDFWVLYQIDFDATGASCKERFFIVPHRELWAIQQQVNDRYAIGYRQRHGTDPDFMAGVDNVKIKDVEAYEDKWACIVQLVSEEQPTRVFGAYKDRVAMADDFNDPLPPDVQASFEK
ncbi:MAG TPA: hypothetical protein VFC78_22840 [Tepidisphaeraceae bacterium]|nr:hypothetical protein [Tepidisphaeraceae bacterium]